MHSPIQSEPGSVRSSTASGANDTEPLLKSGGNAPTYQTLQARSPNPIGGDQDATQLLAARETRSRANSGYSVVAAPFQSWKERHAHKSSIYGPSATPRQRAIFLGYILLMTLFGANNDFLGIFTYVQTTHHCTDAITGEMCYQALPGIHTGFEGLLNRYWIAWLLTFGSFIICIPALYFGWNGGKEWRSMRKEWQVFLSNVGIAGKILICIVCRVCVHSSLRREQNFQSEICSPKYGKQQTTSEI